MKSNRVKLQKADAASRFLVLHQRVHLFSRCSQPRCPLLCSAPEDKSLFWRSVFAPCELESDKRTPRPDVSAFQSFLSEGESKSARCDDLESLKNRNCPTASIENPRGRVVVDKDKPVTNRKDEPGKLKPEQITQIQPQKLTLTLRSGKQLVPGV